VVSDGRFSIQQTCAGLVSESGIRIADAFSYQDLRSVQIPGTLASAMNRLLFRNSSHPTMELAFYTSDRSKDSIWM
jgi:hypothetical protein